MEIHDERLISFLAVLEKIERMNKAISFHQALESPDLLAIEQYEKVKKDLTNYLVELLFSNYQVSMKPVEVKQAA